MRHRKARGKLGRPTQQRIALLRSLVASLIIYEKIETTEAKAKEVKKMVERMVTLAKKGDLHSRRLVLKQLPRPEIVKKLFENIAPRYADHKGGYTQLVKSGFRQGDNAPLVIVEFI